MYLTLLAQPDGVDTLLAAHAALAAHPDAALFADLARWGDGNCS